MTIARIICPVDFSPASRHALEYAMSWAYWHDARVRVLHVVLPSPPIVGPGSEGVLFPPRLLQPIRDEVARFVAEVANPGVVIEIDVREGQPSTVIREVADEDTHAVLVMGTRGRSGFNRILLGSTTERVAHQTKRPLLVVPPRDEPDGRPRATFNRILCAVDFRPSSLAALTAAMAFAREGRATLDVVTVLDMLPEVEVNGPIQSLEPSYHAARSADLLDELAVLLPEEARLSDRVRARVLVGRPWHELLLYAEEHHVNLIVMGTGERFPFPIPWLGRTTDRVMRAAHCPVLIVPAQPHLAARDARPLPPEQWALELDRLTLQHGGEPATVSILSDVLGCEREASALPLVGITVDSHQATRNLSIILGRPDGTRLTHFVFNPTILRIGEARKHRHMELLVTAGDGTTTVVDVGPA